jgi:DNA repair protein RecO (recombination protein O)
MQKHFQTTGVIIRKVDFGEADRIVTVLTDEHGKIDCIAKGGRRINSKFCGRLELLSHVQLNCFQGRDLACLNEAFLINAIPDTKDTERHRALFYIAELTNRIIQINQHIEGAYDLLIDTLHHLEYSEKMETLLHSYIIKILTLSGFIPPWNKCAMCNDGLDLKNPISLNLLDFNLMCHKCATHKDRIIDPPFIKLVNFMQSYPLLDALKVKTEESDRQSVWQWIQVLLGNIFDKPIKAREFLERA